MVRIGWNKAPCDMRQLIRRFLHTMASRRAEDEEAYKLAISTLNDLQTNAATLEIVRRQRGTHRVSEYNKKHQMQQYLHRVGLAPADLQQLHAIHVSGTKGKGSVCAMTESILRCHGLKTGLFVSPHLLEVRERILINGRPLSRASFVSHFWDIYRNLDSTRHLYNDLMPSYFRFLTVMAFSVFLQNKVNVAVVEVGIGGTHDSTNIIQQPIACGVTSLGLDHTDLLGPSLSDIAWHKGGIFKKEVPALTVEQPAEALRVLRQRANELGAQSLRVAPPLYSYPGPPPELGLRGQHQECNASLAVQLCASWLQNHASSSSDETRSEPAVSMATPFSLTQEYRRGLKQCKWSGRNQVVERGRVRYYLDGAHTPESVRASVQWFISEVESRQAATRLLVFNTTGQRDAHAFLQALVECAFHHVVLCPNIVHARDSRDSPADLTNRTVTYESQMSRCYSNQQAYQEVLSGRTRSAARDTAANGSQENQTRVCASVSEAIRYVDSLSASRIDVLVTGSLHLVGSVMTVLGFTVDDI